MADTSPLNYLVQIGAVGILSELYGSVTIPAEVLSELSHPDAPVAIRDWARHVSTWIEVRPVAGTHFDLPLLVNLGAGELAATYLARSADEALLLIDDAVGRREANRLGIATIGTLGFLRPAAIEGLIVLRSVLGKLTRTNFRAPSSVIQQLISEDETRRQSLRC